MRYQAVKAVRVETVNCWESGRLPGCHVSEVSAISIFRVNLLGVAV